MEEKRKYAERALSEKNITITRSDRPKVNIPTYFWLFSQMSDEQTKLVCIWMQALMKKFVPSGPTYTKWMCEKNEKIPLTLPTEVIKGSWQTDDNKTIEWWITPSDEDGFIVEGDISWINKDVRKELPGWGQTKAEKREMKLNRIAEREKRMIENVNRAVEEINRLKIKK